MPLERSDQAYSWYFEASQKFDYFVVGVGVALVGYLGAQFEAVRLGWNPSTIEFSSISALLLSALAGLKRIEANVGLLSFTHKRLHEEEAAGVLTGVASSGSPALNKSTGEFLSPQQAFTKAQYHKAGVEVLSEKLDEAAKWSLCWYRTRNFFLMLGLALLILARVAAAYV